MSQASRLLDKIKKAGFLSYDNAYTLTDDEKRLIEARLAAPDDAARKALADELAELAKDIRSDADNLSPTNKTYPADVMLKWSRRLRKVSAALRAQPGTVSREAPSGITINDLRQWQHDPNVGLTTRKIIGDAADWIAILSLSPPASGIREALEAARQAIEYVIDVSGNDPDPGGFLLQALNKCDAALSGLPVKEEN